MMDYALQGLDGWDGINPGESLSFTTKILVGSLVAAKI